MKNLSNALLEYFKSILYFKFFLSILIFSYMRITNIFKTPTTQHAHDLSLFEVHLTFISSHEDEQQKIINQKNDK